jgi:hypothetical protein
MEKLITRQQLASKLGIDRKTLYNMLKRKGIDIPARQLLTPRDQQQIMRELGFTPAEYGLKK